MTRICGKQDQECAENAKKVMELRLIDNSVNITTPLNISNRPGCGCLPGCFALGYSRAQSSTILSDKINLKFEYMGGKDASYFKKNMAVIHWFFTDTQFTANHRGELFGFTEFLSNTGGLLGLFMGFSFLSAVEIFYFLTLRIWCALGERRANTIHGKSQSLNDRGTFTFAQ